MLSHGTGEDAEKVCPCRADGHRKRDEDVLEAEDTLYRSRNHYIDNFKIDKSLY